MPHIPRTGKSAVRMETRPRRKIRNLIFVANLRSTKKTMQRLMLSLILEDRGVQMGIILRRRPLIYDDIQHNDAHAL